MNEIQTMLTFYEEQRAIYRKKIEERNKPKAQVRLLVSSFSFLALGFFEQLTTPAPVDIPVPPSDSDDDSDDAKSVSATIRPGSPADEVFYFRTRLGPS
jgi:hypothetical protein